MLRREAIVLIGLDRYAEALELFERVCPATAGARRRPPVVAGMPSAPGRGTVRIGAIRRGRCADRTGGGSSRAHARRGQQTLWTTWIWLGRTQQRRGRLAEARATFLQARDAAAEALGPEDANALPYVQAYGMFLHQTGKLDEALALREDLVERSRKTFPNGHINIAKYAVDVGETLAAHDAAAM